MLARGLTTQTIKRRASCWNGSRSFKGEFPWQWRQADVDDFLGGQDRRHKCEPKRAPVGKDADVREGISVDHNQVGVPSLPNDAGAAGLPDDLGTDNGGRAKQFKRFLYPRA